MNDEIEPADVSEAPKPKAHGRYAELNDFVAERVRGLQAAYLRGESGATASLARLRRAISDEPGTNPVVWRETLGLPEQFVGRGDKPSRAERAAHYALTLYATHQQSQGKSMHRGGYSLGRAARQLGKDGSASEQAVLRRFQALGTATSLAEAATHARGLVTQFRGAGIPLDYGKLAAEFVQFQDPRQIGSVRLNWGRDYYRSYRGAGEVEPANVDTATDDTTDSPDNRQGEGS